jgi:C-terminal processing protease CtpA/Prc
MDFNTPFANSNGIIGKTGEHYSYLVKGLEEQETKHFEGRVASFSFGSDTYENFPIGISQANYGLQNDKKVSGIIGNRLLKKYNITFSYSKGAIFLQKNKMFDEPLIVNASGMDIQLSKDKKNLLIHQVYDNSPAENAGIMENDVLLKVNGKSAMEMGIPSVKEILQNAGEKVELVISQRGVEKTVNIQLKELI